MSLGSRFASYAVAEPPPSSQRVKFFKEQSRLRAAALPTVAEVDARGTALASSRDTRGGEHGLREPELPLPE
jgi:hypothetical protein